MSILLTDPIDPKDLDELTTGERISPIHPGKILREEFMIPLKIDVNKLSKALRVPYRRIELIYKEQGGISADTAIRLAKYFGVSELFWMNLQNNYELGIAHFKGDNRFNKILAREMA